MSKVAQIEQNLATLQRHVFGKRSEKMPLISAELQRVGATEVDAEATLAKRREAAEKKKALPTREIFHRVPEAQKKCAKCGDGHFTPLGEGKVTELYEFIPAHVERQVHIQEKLRCRCGEITARYGVHRILKI